MSYILVTYGYNQFSLFNIKTSTPTLIDKIKEVSFQSIVQKLQARDKSLQKEIEQGVLEEEKLNKLKSSTEQDLQIEKDKYDEAVKQLEAKRKREEMEQKKKEAEAKESKGKKKEEKKNQEKKKGKEKKTVVEETVDDKPIVELKEKLEKSEEEKEQEKKEAEKRKEEEDIKENLLSHWSKLLLKEPPKRRSNHTSFIHGDYLYVVGGIDITEHKQDDIYKVNFKEPNATWTKVDLMGDKLEKIAYHAGAEIDGFYYIVGGQNETLETLNTIQVFDITQETMNDKIEFDTEKFPPLESHTVNVNKENNSLIIYGGISGKELNRHIYSFDVQNKEMKNLTQNLKDEETPPPRQDHTAVIYNNALYIYGGLGLDNKIYDDMWKYDFSSNSWSEIVTEAQQKKRDKIKQKKLEQEANNEQKTTDDEEEEELDEDDDEIKDIRPKGRKRSFNVWWWRL